MSGECVAGCLQCVLWLHKETQNFIHLFYHFFHWQHSSTHTHAFIHCADVRMCDRMSKWVSEWVRSDSATLWQWNPLASVFNDIASLWSKDSSFILGAHKSDGIATASQWMQPRATSSDLFPTLSSFVGILRFSDIYYFDLLAFCCGPVSFTFHFSLNLVASVRYSVKCSPLASTENKQP